MLGPEPYGQTRVVRLFVRQSLKFRAP